MSLKDGMAAINLEMPARIPRVEFDAETHWELVKKVTGIHVSVESPDDVKTKATQTFIQAWNYDIKLEPLIGDEELNAKRTCMGHSVYAAGGATIMPIFIAHSNHRKKFTLSIPGKLLALKIKANWSAASMNTIEKTVNRTPIW